MINIELQKTDKQIELIKAMASSNKEEAYAAQFAMAKSIGTVIASALDQAPVLSNMFKTLEFNEFDNATIPLDSYHDISDADLVNVWMQSKPGGLPYNQYVPTDQDLSLTTYDLETASAFNKSHAANSRVDVVAGVFARMAQEILIQQEETSANAILGALAESATNGRQHVQRVETAGNLLPTDSSKLITLADEIDTSWFGGTPTQRSISITDIMVSPYVAELLRAYAFDPVSTNQAHVATEKMRDGIYASAGSMGLFGTNVMKFNEFGKGKRFNKVFDAKAGATSYSKADGTSGAAFDEANEEILVGINRMKSDALIRPVRTNSVNGTTVSMDVDDQHFSRSKKIGFYGGVNEGRIVLDNRALFGLIV